MMISPFPTTHREQIEQLNKKYDDFITQGTYKPFGYPWGAYGAVVVIAYLLTSHQQSQKLRQARYIVWAVNAVHTVYAISRTRARGATCAYGVGIGMAWSLLWVTTILLVHDGQMEFKRIERASDTPDSHPNASSKKTLMRGPTDENFAYSNDIDSTTAIHQRKHMNGLIEPKESSTSLEDDNKLIWQSFPAHSFWQRLDWVMDLMTTFRGATWNFRIPNLPDLPAEVQERMGSVQHNHQHHSGSEGSVNEKKTALVRASLRNLFIAYIMLDILKTISLHDPFFRGLVEAPAPAQFPWLLKSSPVLLRCYRLILTQLCIYWALFSIFQLAPLFFVGLLGSNLIGPRGEYWAYPSEWGSYWSVFERGLAGWWGQWWHQTFRFGFDASSKRIVTLCGMNPRSRLGKITRLFIAFSISGFLHASASHTSIGDTQPIRGPFLFFFLQPFGIIAEAAIAKGLTATGVSQRMPTSVCHVAKFVFVHVWFYHTAPLLVEDVAKGGQLLYEPVPISLLRGVGFGARDDSWYCWSGRWYMWYEGKYGSTLAT
jgi:hypothetical protein